MLFARSPDLFFLLITKMMQVSNLGSMGKSLGGPGLTQVYPLGPHQSLMLQKEK